MFSALAYSLDEMAVVQPLCDYPCDRLVIADHGQTLTSQSQNAKRAMLQLVAAAEDPARDADWRLRVGIARGATGSAFSH